MAFISLARHPSALKGHQPSYQPRQAKAEQDQNAGVEKRAGKLLAKDEVPDAANSSEIHETRFTYRGQRENLVIRVTDKTGDVLAQWGQ